MQGGWVAPWLLSCCAAHCVMQALTVLGVAGPARSKKSRQRARDAVQHVERGLCARALRLGVVKELFFFFKGV